MIKVAVIGAGHWGPHLIRNLHNLQRSRVQVVAEKDPARSAQAASRYPDVRFTDDAMNAIADPEVDAVVIATPTVTHHPLAKAALEAGKHVFVEKPIAASVDEGNELVELSAKANRILMVGHLFVFNAAVKRVKDYLESGHLGRVYYISMVRTNLGPIRMDVDAAWDLAAHDISIVNHWLDAAPLTASATGGSWINSGIADAVFATLRYPEDVLVNLHVSWLNPRKTRDITVVGDHRMAVLDDMNLQEPLRIYDKGVSEETVPSFADTFASFRASIREGDVTIPRVALGEPLRVETEHFLDCIEQGRRPVTDGAMGVDVVRALEAMTRSMLAGGTEEKV